jgi:SAM-dependent methyltransferase
MDPRAEKHDEIAELYDRMRPGYPKAIFQKLQRAANLGSNSRILEVGAGTGQATRDLIKISPHVSCIEPGGRLLKVAKSNLPSVNFIKSTFEDFVDTELFDCIFSATAWHWIDPKVGNRHAYELLSSNGHLAIANNYHVETDPNAFLNRAQPIFASFGTIIGLVTPDQIVADKLEIEGEYFHVIAELEEAWKQTYTIDEYIALRNTYAAHRWMREQDRMDLEKKLRELGEAEFNGQVTQSYRSVLFVAEKRQTT